MFEELTAYLPQLQVSSFGKWHIDRKNDGSSEHPFQFPYVDYEDFVTEFMKSAYSFVDQHKEMRLNHYYEILNHVDIEWGSESMRQADVSVLDGQTVMALIIGVMREERFSEGALMTYLQDGSIEKWLTRLQEIDNGAPGMVHNS